MLSGWWREGVFHGGILCFFVGRYFGKDPCYYRRDKEGGIFPSRILVLGGRSQGQKVMLCLCVAVTGENSTVSSNWWEAPWRSQSSWAEPSASRAGGRLTEVGQRSSFSRKKLAAVQVRNLFPQQTFHPRIAFFLGADVSSVATSREPGRVVVVERGWLHKGLGRLVSGPCVPS